MDNGTIKKQTFSGDDEKQVLKEAQSTLNKCGKLDFYLCGHNLKNFDIPMMAKRMIINNILPPKIFPTYDTKPWEVKAIDTRDVWQYGQYASISTLDLMCGVMGVESSKSDEMDGSRVHEVFYKEKNIDKINTYCEKDVKVLYEVVKKLQNLL
jgi:predicted PolB exonuclease-like 3'-5' exonuclease